MFGQATTAFSRPFARAFTPARVGTLLAFVGLVGFGQSAHADTLTLGSFNHPFYVSATNMTVRPGEVINLDHVQDMGGDAKGVLNVPTRGAGKQES